MKKTIAVIFGGRSPEHDISIITAIAAIIKPLKVIDTYTIVPIYITKNGAWYSHESFSDVATFQSGKLDGLLAQLKPLTLSFDGGLSIEKPGLRRQKVAIDVVFPAMHGSYGEDGSLMGMLRMAGIPFVGCDMTASVIAMDKVLAKQLAEANHTSISKYEFFDRKTFETKGDEIVKKLEKSLKYPMFVKPAHLGSSIGITRVARHDELRNAIEVAAFYDDKILIEEAVQNLIEVTVPIMGNSGGQLQVAMVERPIVHDDEVFDFDTKYLSGGKKTGGGKRGAQGYSELPANIPKALYDESVEVAKSIYRMAECEGIARIDLLIDSKAKVVYFNEINPLPGSLYAHNWRQAGVSNIDLVTRLIDLAFERYERQQKLQSTFQTNFLKQF